MFCILKNVHGFMTLTVFHSTLLPPEYHPKLYPRFYPEHFPNCLLCHFHRIYYLLKPRFYIDLTDQTDYRQTINRLDRLQTDQIEKQTDYRHTRQTRQILYSRESDQTAQIYYRQTINRLDRLDKQTSKIIQNHET